MVGFESVAYLKKTSTAIQICSLYMRRSLYINARDKYIINLLDSLFAILLKIYIQSFITKLHCIFIRIEQHVTDCYLVEMSEKVINLKQKQTTKVITWLVGMRVVIRWLDDIRSFYIWMAESICEWVHFLKDTKILICCCFFIHFFWFEVLIFSLFVDWLFTP